MKKRILNLLLMIMVLVCGLALYGCGDKYADLSISISFSEDVEVNDDGSINMYLGDNYADDITLTITMENAPDNFNYIPFYTLSNEFISIAEGNNLITNGVEKTITAIAPGTTVLTAYTNEGAKSASLKINVIKYAKSVSFKSGYTSFGVPKEYGAALQLSTSNYLEILPTDSNQRDIKYQLLNTDDSIYEGNDFYINEKSGLIRLINPNSTVENLIIRAYTIGEAGGVVESFATLTLVEPIKTTDIAIFKATTLGVGDSIDVSTYIRPTDIISLIKNYEELSTIDIIIRVASNEVLNVSYLTDTLNMPVIVSKRNDAFLTQGGTWYYGNADYQFFAYKISASRSTFNGAINYENNTYLLDFKVGYNNYVVDNYPISNICNVQCDSYIKTFDVNGATVQSATPYNLVAYKSDFTKGTPLTIGVANPLSIRDANATFKLMVYRCNSNFENAVLINDSFNDHLSIIATNSLLNPSTLMTANSFSKNTTFYVKAKEEAAIGGKFILKFVAIKPDFEQTGVIPAEVNVNVEIKQGIEEIRTYTFVSSSTGEDAVVGNFDNSTHIGDTAINLNLTQNEAMDVNFGVYPLNADTAKISFSSADSGVVKAVAITGEGGAVSLKLNPVAIGNTQVTVQASTLQYGYIIDVNVFYELESFKINLQSTLNSDGIGTYENSLDNCLTNATVKTGMDISMLMTVNPTTAEYRQVDFDLQILQDLVYVDAVYEQSNNTIIADNFIFDTSDMSFRFGGTNAVNKTYKVIITVINYDGGEVSRELVLNCYVPVAGLQVEVSKTTLYNPEKINFENKSNLTDDSCDVSFYAIAQTTNADATYNFSNSGSFYFTINGDISSVITPFTTIGNKHYFKVDEAMIDAIISFPQVVYLVAQINELGVIISRPVMLVLREPVSTESLVAENVQKERLYFKKDVDPAFTANTFIYPSTAHNTDVYIKQFKYNPQTDVYTDVTDDEDNKIFNLSTLKSAHNNCKFTITPVRAGQAILIVLPKDKVLTSQSFDNLSSGTMLEVIDIWNKCLAITIDVSDGSKENPYQIDTYEELCDIGASSTALSKYYVMTGSINCSAIEFVPIGQSVASSGAGTGMFTGGLDGVHKFRHVKTGFTTYTQYSIIGLRVENGNCLFTNYGLFYMIDTTGEANNLNLEFTNLFVTFNNECAFGGVTGKNYGTITNCRVKYTNTFVSSSTSLYFGGLAGLNYGTINNKNDNLEGMMGAVSLTINGTIDNFYAGGIAGGNYGKIEGSFFAPNITPSINSGDVGYSSSLSITVAGNINNDSNTAVGGLVGFMGDATEGKTTPVANIYLKNSSVQGKIYANTINRVGGAVGYIEKGTIYNVLSNTNVTGNNNVGGAIGYANASVLGQVLISYCSAENYSISATSPRTFVKGISNVGGLIGTADKIDLSYSYAVTYFENSADYDLSAASVAGGLIGGATNSSVMCCASLLNIHATSLTSIGGFIGSNIGNTLADYFYRELNGTEQAATITNIENWQTDEEGYYIHGIQYFINNGNPYLLNQWGGILFATLPLQIVANIVDNNNETEFIECDYSAGYISTGQQGIDDFAILFYNYVDDESLSKEQLENLNTFKLEDIADFNIYPLTSKSARVVVASSDPSVIKVNTDGTLTIMGTGATTITASSKLNGNYFAKITFNVYYGISQVGVYEDANYYDEISGDDLTILKSTTKTIYVSSKYNVQLPELVEISTLKSSEQVNMRYYVKEDKLGGFVIDNLFNINGNAWAYDSDTASYYIDIRYGENSTIIPISSTDNLAIEIHYYPYIEYSHNARLGQVKMLGFIGAFDLIIRRGAISIALTDSLTEITMAQLYTYDVTVKMETDYALDDINLANLNIIGNSEYSLNDLIIVGENTIPSIVYKKVYNSVTNAYDTTSEINYMLKTYSITFADKENMLTENRTYKLIFCSDSVPTLRFTLTLIVTPQGILDVEFGLYSKESYYMNRDPEKTLYVYNGQSALLTVDVLPYFSMYDSFDLLYTTETNYSILITQRKYNAEENIFEDYPTGGSIYTGGVGLFTQKITGYDCTSTSDLAVSQSYSYSKRYFYSMVVASDVPDYSEFSLQLRFYSHNQQVKPFDCEFKFTTVSKPDIFVTATDNTLIGVDNAGYFPLGTTNNLTITLKNYVGDIAFRIEGVEWVPSADLIESLMPVYENGIYTITVPKDAINVLGKKLKLLATIVKDEIDVTYSFDFVITMFTITDINVSGLSNNVLTNTVYTISPLKVQLSTYYNKDAIASIFANNNTLADLNIDARNFAEYLAQLENAFSKYPSWYCYDRSFGNTSFSYAPLEAGNSYNYVNGDPTFEVDMYDTFYSVYGYNVDVTSSMKNLTYVGYDEFGLPDFDNYAVEMQGGTYGYSFIYDKDFTMAFAYRTSLINAIPISTPEEFLAMEADKDYRLVNDIVLADYTPIDVNFASFDGNNFTIFVLSFSYASDFNGVASLGLFSTVYETSMVINTTVYYTDGLLETVPGDGGKFADDVISKNSLKISLVNAIEVNFGGITPTNYGAISNATVKGKINITVNVNAENDATIADATNGALVANNFGNLTNCKVLGFEFNGYGNIGGVVGINSGLISATYTSEIKVANMSSNFTGGFVYNNTEDGRIYNSYVEGKRGSSTSIINNGEGIQSKGNVGGFVYGNYGEIKDCYSNISMSSSGYIAGFVYTGENSVIKNCYTIAIRQGINNSVDSAFTGRPDSGVVTDVGEISDCFYCKDSWVVVKSELAKGLTADQFGTTAEFSAFDIATDSTNYDDGLAVYDGYNWVMKDGKPILVATMVDTVSQQRYNGKVSTYKDSVTLYEKNESNLFMQIGSILTQVLQPNNTYVDAIETGDADELVINIASGESLKIKFAFDEITRLTYPISATYGTEDLNRNLEIIYYYRTDNAGIISYDRLADDPRNITYNIGSDKVELYFDEPSNNFYKIVYYELKDTIYNYSEAIENISKTMGDKSNPYLIYDYESFNFYLSQQQYAYYRFINDIDLTAKSPATSYKNFMGVLQGNHLTISNINITHLIATAVDVDGFGIFSSITDSPTKSTAISNLNLLVNEVASLSHQYVGGLAGYVSGNNNNVFVNDISVTMQDADGYVVGKNMVGGLIGYALGNVSIKEIYCSVWVNAARDLFMQNNKLAIYERINTETIPQTATEKIQKIRESLLMESTVPYEELFDRYYNAINDLLTYAGGAVGVLDCNQIRIYNNDVMANAEDVVVGSDAIVVGGFVGGIFGFVGKDAWVNNITLLADPTQYLSSSGYIGGLIGENRGKLTCSSIKYEENYEENIDIEPLGTINTSSNLNFFRILNVNSIDAIGGLVGFNNGGTISECISKIDVVNKKAIIAGGAVGRDVGGTYENVVATGAVIADVIMGGLVGTVNNTHTLVNDAGFVYTAQEDLLPIQATSFTNCIAANNHRFQDFGFITTRRATGSRDYVRIIGGIVGLQVARVPEGSAVTYSSNYQDCFFVNTLHKDNLETDEYYINPLNRGEDYDKATAPIRVPVICDDYGNQIVFPFSSLALNIEGQINYICENSETIEPVEVGDNRTFTTESINSTTIGDDTLLIFRRNVLEQENRGDFGVDAWTTTSSITDWEFTRTFMVGGANVFNSSEMLTYTNDNPGDDTQVSVGGVVYLDTDGDGLYTWAMTEGSNSAIAINGINYALGGTLLDGGIVEEIEVTIWIDNSVSGGNGYKLHSIKIKTHYDLENCPNVVETSTKNGGTTTYKFSVLSKKMTYFNLLLDSGEYWNVDSDFYLQEQIDAVKYLKISINPKAKVWATPIGYTTVFSTTVGDTNYIRSAEDLTLLAEKVNSGISYAGVNFVLSTDIDLSGKYFTPIGNAYAPFEGSFDGKGSGDNYHVIKYAMVNKRGNDGNIFEHAGLFGFVENATIKNVTVLGGNIEGIYAGGIVGLARDSSLINNRNKNSVVGYQMAGGIVANAEGSIATSCNNTALVKLDTANNLIDYDAYTISSVVVYTHANIYIGGIAGTIDGIYNCSNSGKVQANDSQTTYTGNRFIKLYAGGIAGYVERNLTGEILGSSSGTVQYNSGDVKIISNAHEIYVGGIAGYASSNVALLNQYKNIGEVYVENRNSKSADTGYAITESLLSSCPIYAVGGIVGYSNANIYRVGNENKVTLNCSFITYSIGGIGGIAGIVADKDVSQSYNVDTITSNLLSMRTISMVGGIVGASDRTSSVEKTYLIDNYNSGSIEGSNLGVSILGGIMGGVITHSGNYLTIGVISIQNESIALPADPIDNGELVEINYNYNIGNVTIASKYTSKNATGAISGYCANTVFNFNFYLEGSSDSGSMIYGETGTGTSSAFVANTAITENQILNLPSVDLKDRLNTLFCQRDEGDGNPQVWEKKYAGWYPTLIANTTEVLWSNYRQELIINGGVYTISTAEQLSFLAHNVNNGSINTAGKTYRLENTIDLANRYFTPIGNSNFKFLGTFDGNGYLIKNLTINGNIILNDENYAIIDGASYGGLFGYVSNATLTKIGLESVQIDRVAYAGSIACYVNNSLIEKSYSDGYSSTIIVEEEGLPVERPISIPGKIEAETGAGGLVYDISNCVPASTNNFKNGVYKCYNNIQVKANLVGGLIGTSANAYVKDCYNGLEGTVFSGAMDLKESVNSIIGSYGGVDDLEFGIENCYSIGGVTDESSFKGSIIYSSSSDVFCVANGDLPTVNVLRDYGWDMTNVWTAEYTLNPLQGAAFNAANDYPSLRGIGKNWKNSECEQLKPYASYQIEEMIHDGLYLTYESSEDSGSAVGTYEGSNVKKYFVINNAEELAWISKKVNDGSLNTFNTEIILNDDINLNGRFWTPIGKNSSYCFKGMFNFNGHTIHGLTIDSTSDYYAGLFGYAKNATIKDGYISNAYIKVACDDPQEGLFAGTLVATGSSLNILNMSIETSVSAFSANAAYVGGVIGSVITANEVNSVINNVRVFSNSFVETQTYAEQVSEGQVLSTSINIGAFSNGGNTYAGGIAGSISGTDTASSAIIIFADNSANVASICARRTSSYAGGIAGRSSQFTSIKVCQNSGIVKSYTMGEERVGGIVGYTFGDGLTDGEGNLNGIINCLNTGYIECCVSLAFGHISYLGGIAGYVEFSNIGYCVNIGSTYAYVQNCVSGLGGIAGYIYSNPTEEGQSLLDVFGRGEGMNLYVKSSGVNGSNFYTAMGNATTEIYDVVIGDRTVRKIAYIPSNNDASYAEYFLGSSGGDTELWNMSGDGPISLDVRIIKVICASGTQLLLQEGSGELLAIDEAMLFEDMYIRFSNGSRAGTSFVYQVNNQFMVDDENELLSDILSLEQIYDLIVLYIY